MKVTIEGVKAIMVDENIFNLDAKGNWEKEWSNGLPATATLDGILEFAGCLNFYLVDNETAFELYEYYRLGTAVFHNVTTNLWVWVVDRDIKVNL